MKDGSGVMHWYFILNLNVSTIIVFKKRFRVKIVPIGVSTRIVQV